VFRDPTAILGRWFNQDTGEKSSEDQEALVMCFDTGSGNIFMNIAIRYGRRRRSDPKPG